MVYPDNTYMKPIIKFLKNYKALKKPFFYIAHLTFILSIYQNCGVQQEMEFNSLACKTGEKLGIELLMNETDETVGIPMDQVDIVAYEGPESALENYNYYSSSAHPIHGPTPVDNNVNVFFYKDAAGINLSFFANIDDGGSEESKFDLDIQIKNNSLNDRVIIADDIQNGKPELVQTAKGKYSGRFVYWKNTDGGVIGPIELNNNVEIKVKFLDTGDNKTARFYSSNGASFALEKAGGSISSFRISYKGYEDCQN